MRKLIIQIYEHVKQSNHENKSLTFIMQLGTFIARGQEQQIENKNLFLLTHLIRTE